MFKNPFVLEATEYKRDVQPVNEYISQSAAYLNKMTGHSVEECQRFVKASLSNGSFPAIRDPKVVYLERGENGDRIKKETTLNQYLTDSLRRQQLIAPTFTTYLNPKQKESLLVKWVEGNVKARGVAKKAKFAAEAAGNDILAAVMEVVQTNKKLSNNAVSGAHVSESTPLLNKTAHSSLTSTCRTTSGYGNASNEKILNGNRHYWSPSILMNNIISIVSHTNYEELDAMLKRYNLVIPSVDQVMACIKLSTEVYWSQASLMVPAYLLVEKLNPLERAAFVYTGDLFQVMILNPEFIRGFIRELSQKVTTNDLERDYNPHTLHEDYVNLAHQICASTMMDKGKDYKALKGTQTLADLYVTAEHVQNVVMNYADFIKCIFVTDNMPASVAYFPASVRKAALTSDTDSTIFTVQDWVSWYCGSYAFDEEGMSIAATMIFIASQGITHVLAKMSANLGIAAKRIHQIAMKNEFKFDTFTPTNVAKHYFANISCQEGNVYGKRKVEIKGVHLKSSNVPTEIIKEAEALMIEIMDTVVKGKKISILKVLKQIGDRERMIRASIAKGDAKFFRLLQIKTSEAYKQPPDKSNYRHYLMWNALFAEKYGSVPPPPYTCIGVSTSIDTPTKLKAWLDGMKDRELAKRMTDWFVENKRDNLPTIYLSVEIARANGIPPEILEIINIRQMIANLTKIYYLVLETLGVYINSTDGYRLVSDDY